MAVAATTVVALVTVLPVVRTRDLLEFFGGSCLACPFLVACSAVAGLIAHAMLVTPHLFLPVAAIFGFAATFALAFVASVPVAILGWRKARPLQDPSRCYGCGYRVDNLPGPRCPECGREFAGSGE